MRSKKQAAPQNEMVVRLQRHGKEAQALCKRVAAMAEVRAEHVKPQEITDERVADLGLAVGYLSQALEALSGMSPEEAAAWLADEVKE